ncbi:MAG: hypothetical protein WC208_10315, partial [Gallionella sp.]
MEQEPKFNPIMGGAPEPSKELTEFLKKQTQQIKDCEIFMAFYTTSYEKNPLCLLQISIAMTLNKPMFLLVEEGVLPNDKIISMLDGVAYFKKDDPESIKNATAYILQ